MKTKHEYEADERPNLVLTEKGRNAASDTYMLPRSYTLTESAKALLQAEKEVAK